MKLIKKINCCGLVILYMLGCTGAIVGLAIGWVLGENLLTWAALGASALILLSLFASWSMGSVI